MNTYTCKKFTGHYPVGSAAVVRHESREEAARLLNDALKREGLPGDAKPEDMIPLAPDPIPTVRILNDGNY